MPKKTLLVAVAAVAVSALLAPAAHAASMDINIPSVTNVKDVAGVLTGSTTINFLANFTNAPAPLNGGMITSPDAFSFTANFNTTTNAFTSGTFSLSGTLRDAGMTNLGTITFGGTLTGLTVTPDGTGLVFGFNTVNPGSPTSADTTLDSAFGPKGILQLHLALPTSTTLGQSFTTSGTSTVDLTAVPTPSAAFAGLTLLGGLAAVRYFRKPKFSC